MPTGARMRAQRPPFIRSSPGPRARWVVAAGALFTLLAVCSSARASIVTEWNAAALSAIRAASTPPPVASRALAMMHGAVYDAVNAIDKTHNVYQFAAAPPPGASAEAAAAQSAYTVLSSLFPAGQSSFDTLLNQQLAAIPTGSSKTDGIALGQNIAGRMLTWRSGDHSTDTVSYTPGAAPGQWRPTPPANAPALLPQWPGVTPFAMTSGSQFRGAGPPALSSAAYAAAVNDVKSLGSKTSAARTADQTQIAQFWADGGATATPPGHWNEIAQSLAQSRGQNLQQDARMFALLNVALADAAIVAWDNKYTYNLWRPITAIQLAADDGNDATVPDPAWEPLLVTPPFPEYVSGHSTFSGAGSAVLADFFGSNAIPFTIGSDALPGVERSFASFSDAAQEAGRSRIYGGIHFEFSNQEGLGMGQSLGHYVTANFMTEVPEPAAIAGMAITLLALGRRQRRFCVFG